MNNTITIQEVRRDLPGFLKRLADGATLTVISRSKPLVTVTSQSSAAAQPKGARHFLALAAEAHESAKVVLDPHKSIKALYAETAAEKHGLR